MSALKEFANFITLNVANLAATYDRLLVENSESYTTLPTDSRIAQARKLIKKVAEACEAEIPDSLLDYLNNRTPFFPSLTDNYQLPVLLTEVECLGQTLTPVVTSLEAGKFLWHLLFEARATIFRSISPASSLTSTTPIHSKLINPGIQQSDSELSQEWTLLRTLIDNMPDYIYAKDSESRFTLLNVATAHLLGASSVNEVIGQSDFDYFPAELAGQFRTDELVLMKSGQPLLNQEEKLVDSTTGQIRWNLSSKIPLRDNQGNIIGLVGVNRDITKRKLAEEAFRSSEERLRTVTNNVPIVLFTLDRDGVFTLSEGKGLSRLGLESGQAVGLSAFDMYRDFPDILEAVQRGLAGETFSIVTEVAGLTFETRYSPLRDQSGELTGTIGVAIDITEHKQLEDQLRDLVISETRQQYQQILDGITDMILVKGPKSRIIWANHAFRDYYGMTNEQLQNLIDAPFNEPDYTQQYVKDDEHVFITGQTLDIPEEPVTRYDGEVHLFHTVKSALRNNEGKIVMTVGVSRDITERRQVEAERERLIAEAERRAKREETIREITNKLRAAPNLQQLAIIATRELNERLGGMYTGLEIGIKSQITPENDQQDKIKSN